MEVVVPRLSPDFAFTEGVSPRDIIKSAPSSPKPFGNPVDYFYHHASAPTSPTRASAIYAHFNSTTGATTSPEDDAEPDFAFDFSGQLEMGVAADDLFEDGKIRALKPPADVPLRLEILSPRNRESRKRESLTKERSGRERNLSSRSRRATRSLSPLRGEGVVLFQKNPVPSPSPSTIQIKDGAGSKRWSLKDLFLFRSASEGRATGRVSKDTLLSRSGSEDRRNVSLRSTGNNNNSSMTTTTTTEETKKKTPLLRHGLFGYLRFNPAVHSIARGHSNNGNPLSRGRP